ncbi:glycosyltransferase family 2 protein [Aurantibacter sp.]|uniref:glycosyltransferase family 2 protein n=1 Tax=Aurantibacter sp. TaxID=2807103 RepID=UPI0035C7B28C
MKLSVIILNYNVQYFLQLCLQSVEAAISNIDAEIIVIDNNSKDESRLMVETHFPNVRWIQNTENVGFSKANNQAVKVAKGEYLCVLNPDTVIAEDTFTKLLEFAETKNNLGIVGCQLIDGKGQYLPESKRNVPTPKVALKKLLGNSDSYYANHLKKDEIGKVSIFVGAFMLLKQEVYSKVGGFDERYFMYGEDIDLSYKIEKAGFNNYYFGETTIIHFKGESTLKDKIYAKRFFGAMQIFYKSHFKSNVFTNVLVWLGIQVAKLISKRPKALNTVVNNYILISNKLVPKLQIALRESILVSKDINVFKSSTEYILDVNYLFFSDVIRLMRNSEQQKSVSFKILPKKSNFILGSQNSENRGEILHF